MPTIQCQEAHSLTDPPVNKTFPEGHGSSVQIGADALAPAFAPEKEDLPRNKKRQRVSEFSQNNDVVDDDDVVVSTSKYHCKGGQDGNGPHHFIHADWKNEWGGEGVDEKTTKATPETKRRRFSSHDCDNALHHHELNQHALSMHHGYLPNYGFVSNGYAPHWQHGFGTQHGFGINPEFFFSDVTYYQPCYYPTPSAQSSLSLLDNLHGRKNASEVLNQLLQEGRYEEWKELYQLRELWFQVEQAKEAAGQKRQQETPLPDNPSQVLDQLAREGRCKEWKELYKRVEQAKAQARAEAREAIAVKKQPKKKKKKNKAAAAATAELGKEEEENEVSYPASLFTGADEAEAKARLAILAGWKKEREADPAKAAAHAAKKKSRKKKAAAAKKVREATAAAKAVAEAAKKEEKKAQPAKFAAMIQHIKIERGKSDPEAVATADLCKKCFANNLTPIEFVEKLKEKLKQSRMAARASDSKA